MNWRSDQNRLYQVIVTVIAGCLCLASFAHASEEHESSEIELGWTLLIAFALTLVHLLASPTRRLLQKKEAFMRSCGGGMAISYVFLQLLPEIDKGHYLIGNAIYFVMLIGFVLFYALEYHLPLHNPREMHAGPSKFTFCLHLAISWLYSWLIIYAIPKELETSAPHAFIGVIVIGLHLFYKDYILGRHSTREFDSWGRYVLASAPLAGWGAYILVDPTSEVVSDILIAVLGGSIIYNVLRDELPDRKQYSFYWFVFGVVVYACLLMVSTVVGE